MLQLVKGTIYDPVINYNNVEDTKVSVSIKKLMPSNALKLRDIFLFEILNDPQRLIPDTGL